MAEDKLFNSKYIEQVNPIVIIPFGKIITVISLLVKLVMTINLLISAAQNLRYLVTFNIICTPLIEGSDGIPTRHMVNHQKPGINKVTSFC